MLEQDSAKRMTVYYEEESVVEGTPVCIRGYPLLGRRVKVVRARVVPKDSLCGLLSKVMVISEAKMCQHQSLLCTYWCNWCDQNSGNMLDGQTVV